MQRQHYTPTLPPRQPEISADPRSTRNRDRCSRIDKKGIIATCDGCVVRIEGADPDAEVHIHDMAGKTVCTDPDRTLRLAPGIYLVTGAGATATATAKAILK
ncbi:MAG: hypothetical protein K2J06_06840 [Muribaculaceae bacterium]|nr:hypothetical protein [Muribaculaceae bacterium]